MSSTNTKILNWQDFISGWSFTCGGEAPPQGLAETYSFLPSSTEAASPLPHGETRRERNNAKEMRQSKA